MPDHGEIVRDEQEGDTQFFTQLEDQFDDPGLNGGIKRGHGLVGDDQFRLGDQRPGQRNTLPLAARQFLRVAIHDDRVQAYCFQRCSGFFFAAGRDSNAEMVQRFHQGLQDASPGAERSQ